MPAKPPIYAANHRQVAKVLGLNPARRGVLKQIGGWIQQPDFPRKKGPGKKVVGWLVVEVKAWYARFKRMEDGGSKIAGKSGTDDQPGLGFDSPPAQLRKRLEYNLDIYLNPQKHVNPMTGSARKLNGQEVKELQRYRMIPQLEATQAEEGGGMESNAGGAELHPPNGGGGAATLGHAANQTALTEILARQFGQKFGFILTENKVSEWLRGKGVPPGRALPPTKIKGRFNVDDWASWVNDCFAVNGDSGQAELLRDYSNRIEMAELKTKESNAELAEIEKNKALAKYVLADAARNQRRAGYNLLLTRLGKGLENDDPRKRLDWITSRWSGKVPAEELAAFKQFDLELAKSRRDALIADCRLMKAEDIETELAKQLAEDAKRN